MLSPFTVMFLKSPFQVRPKYEKLCFCRSRWDQSGKYSAYVIEHFPYMELEDSRLADRFANTVDLAYERGTALGLSDEEFRIEISNAFDKWLGGKKPDRS